ncbi:MAG TPA: DUF4132 domain-containing protein, partial [Ktedonobacterales bacterium]|nr:DUF4132 domain-containing protein [Ktedonobacterales bacterium]
TLSNSTPQSLHEIDQRSLDICIATNNLEMILESLPEEAPIEALYHYLRTHQTQQQPVLEYLIACYDWMRNEKPAPLGRLLLCYLPEQFPAMLPLMQQNNWDSEYQEFLELLISAQPPFVDLAWQTVQQVSQGDLGDCVAPLLKVDPARFRDWAQQIASPNGPGDESDQVTALRALFDEDFANNIDLAVTIATDKRTFSNRWNTRRARQSALGAVYRSDPAQYLYLVDEAIVSKEYYLYDTALDLLENADKEQIRPVLQHCVSAGTVQAAVRATRRLLADEWVERQNYALSLLAHRAKQIRDLALEWLAPQGEALIEEISHLLSDKSAFARLSAVEFLARLGGERAHALLAARREVEKAISVKQAIVDIIGLPELPANYDLAVAIEATLIEAATAGKTSPLRWLSAPENTGLRWMNGSPVPISVIYYLFHCQKRMKQTQLDLNARRILSLLDRKATPDLALTLLTSWVKQGANAKEGWLLPLIAMMGDDRLVQPLRRQIDAWGKKSKRRAMGIKAVQTLALLNSDLALTEVSDLARHSKSGQIKQAARQAFAEAASRFQLSHEELADRISPRFGFNEKGEQLLDYGPRQFTARLGFDLTIHLSDSSGKRLISLPRTNARDNAAKVAAAQGAWQVLKKHLPPAIKMQTERLENALSTQRSWSVARWRELFLQHPLMRAFAVNLVWGVVAPGESAYQMLFRPLEDGSLTDHEDNAVVLPDVGQIRMVQPIELDEETRQSWLQHLTDYEITPPFPQLNRQMITLDETSQQSIWWEQYAGYRVAGKLIKDGYQRAGWEPGKDETGESYNLIWKAFSSAGIEALLEISYLVAGYERSWPATIIRLGFGRSGTVEHTKQASAAAAESNNDDYDYYSPYKIDEAALLKLGEVPPVVLSEAAANVQSFAALGHYDPDWQKKATEDPDDDIPF